MQLPGWQSAGRHPKVGSRPPGDCVGAADSKCGKPQLPPGGRQPTFSTRIAQGRQPTFSTRTAQGRQPTVIPAHAGMTVSA
ncbi:MAG: hypothetical protein FWG73_02885 [Planctomycetaceae bacterium]|nr:hypothetical protein [Planctomycetaceae bacterium]